MNRTTAAVRVLAAACLVLLPLACAPPPATTSARLAVAANFVGPAEALAEAFAAATTHNVEIVSGSTGQLYAQIVAGAPFDVLVAADQEYATRLAADGLGVAGTQSTYAIGRLALFTREPARFAPLTLDALRRDDYRALAIANPDLAPYGTAAIETIAALGLTAAVEPRLVRGQNIAQAFAMVETRNAELGLVALSQALAYDGEAAFVEVPERYHTPIRQDVILLARATDNAAARAFLEFLTAPEAAALLRQFGYGVPASSDPKD